MALQIVRNRRWPPPLSGTVNWGALSCGAFITIGLAFLAMVLGGAAGLASIDVMDPIPLEDWSDWLPVPPPQSSLVGWVYYCVTWVGSFMIGGYCVSKLAQIEGRRSSVIYGLVLWALVTVLSVVGGALFSPVFFELLAGTSSQAVSWLVFAVLSVGAFASIWGSFLGRTRLPKETLDTKAEPELKKVS